MSADAPNPDAARVRRRLRALAKTLDASIPLPGTDRKIGLDGLIGLIPGVGDAAGMVLSGYIVAQAARLGAPVPVLLRMGMNVGLEALVGLVPIVGDLFDFVWKANQKNVALLEAHLDRPAAVARSSQLALWGVAAVIGLALAGLVALSWVIVSWLVGLIG